MLQGFAGRKMEGVFVSPTPNYKTGKIRCSAWSAISQVIPDVRHEIVTTLLAGSVDARSVIKRNCLRRFVWSWETSIARPAPQSRTVVTASWNHVRCGK
jgi:hypothetical protein